MNNPATAERIAALVAAECKNYSATGAGQATLPEKIIALENALLRLDGENARLKSESRTAEQRAVEIAAAQGVPVPAKADADKSSNAEAKKVLTGVDAVEAYYAEKYGVSMEKISR